MGSTQIVADDTRRDQNPQQPSNNNDERHSGILEKLGLTRLEAKIYTGLLLCGASKARPLSSKLGLNRVDTYRVLRRLISRGLVTITIDQPTSYEAVTPRSAIRILLKEAERKTREIRESARCAVSHLENLEKKGIHSYDDPPKYEFRLFRGEAVTAKHDEMILEAKRSVIGIWSLKKLSYLGLPQPLAKCRKRGVIIQILCEIERRNIPMLTRLVNLAEVRHHNDLEGAARFTTIDGQELLLSASSSGTEKRDMLSLWSNRRELVQGLSQNFKSLWNEATDYSERIAHLKTL